MIHILITPLIITLNWQSMNHLVTFLTTASSNNCKCLLHFYVTLLPGWGYQLLHALLQDTKDELALVEAVEAHVLLEANEQTLFPVFRLILQLLYDEGTYVCG